MSDDNKLDFILNLDGSEFANSVTDSISKLETLGTRLATITEIGGMVAAAGLAIKTAFDMTMEAETLAAVNNQFEMLTRNAGLSGDALKEGLIKAADGLVTENDLLKAANKSVIEMGVSAAKLPQVMDLARKATAAFGGDLLTNFESINQAIATGATRQLRSMGIVLDSNKAMRDYASAMGITVSEMSQAEEQQARLNAVLDKGKSAFNGVNVELLKNHNAWQQFKVSIVDASDTIASTIGRVAGDNLNQDLTLWTKLMSSAGTTLKSMFGSGTEQAAATAEILTGKIRDLQGEITTLQAKKAQTKDLFLSAELEAEIKSATQELQGYQSQLTKIQATKEKLSEQSKSGAGSSGAPAPQADQAKRLQEQVRFNQEILSLRRAHEQAMVNLSQQETQAEMLHMTSVSDADRIYNQQRIQEAKKYQQQIDLIRQEGVQKEQEIRVKLAQGQMTQAEAQKEISEIKRRNDEIVVLNRLKNQALEQDDKKRYAMEDQALQNNLQKSKTFMEAFAAEAQLASHKATQGMTDFANLGKVALDSFHSNFVSAFQKMGEGQANACDVMKQIFFGMIGDEAAQMGEFVFLSSIWPPNPAGLAAAAGLFALSGLLKSMSGGTSASTNSAGGGSAGVSTADVGGGYNPIASTFPTPNNAQAAQKSVTIQIQGHYMDTTESRMWLVEQLRAASDATDFQVRSN